MQRRKARDQEETRIQISHAHERAASYIADFLATRQDIIRATPCYEALRCFGRRFASRQLQITTGAFPTDTIQEFGLTLGMEAPRGRFARSWCGKMALQPISAGTLASLLLVCLFVLAIFPAMKGRLIPTCSIWGMVGGTLVAIVTLIGWQCRTPVFVDVICIHQSDPGLKSEALLSLGAFLQSSESLHVWWDETFVDRQGRYEQRVPLRHHV